MQQKQWTTRVKVDASFCTCYKWKKGPLTGIPMTYPTTCKKAIWFLVKFWLLFCFHNVTVGHSKTKKQITFRLLQASNEMKISVSERSNWIQLEISVQGPSQIGAICPSRRRFQLQLFAYVLMKMQKTWYPIGGYMYREGVVVKHKQIPGTTENLINSEKRKHASKQLPHAYFKLAHYRNRSLGSESPQLNIK